MDDHENTDVTLLLQRAAHEAPADLDASAAVSGAVRRGQQLRSRRARVQLVGVLAVAASVAGGMVVVHEWASPPPSDSVVLAPTRSPTEITTVRSAPRGTRAITRVYTELLTPYGTVGDVTSYLYGYVGQRMAQGLLSDAAGPGAVNVMVMRDTSKADDTVGCSVDGIEVVRCETLPKGSLCPTGLRCVAPDDGVVEACPPAAERTAGSEPCVMLADGTVVASQTSPTYKDQRDQGEYVNEATAYRPDGLQVNARAYNGPGEKLGAARAAPALTVEQLRTIVVNSAWADVDLGN